MITENGKWCPQGLEENDGTRIKTTGELTEFVNSVGFLPMFSNEIPGFSMEEHVTRHHWWSGDSNDPWEWRTILAKEGNVAYGKLFMGKAAFVSKECYPLLASFRRDGYDFDSRYEDGCASYKSKNIMDIIYDQGKQPTYKLKDMAGFGRGGIKGFEGEIGRLQMQTYLIIREFSRRVNKRGEEYGWEIAVMDTPESLFGEEAVRSAYSMEPKKAKLELCEYIISHFPKHLHGIDYTEKLTADSLMKLL